MPTADGQIRIIVGAELSRDVETTFGKIPKIAERAAREAAKAMGAGATETAKQMRGTTSDAERAVRERGKLLDKEFAAVTKAANAERKVWDNAQKERIRGEEQASRAVSRLQERETRDKEREAQKQTRDSAREIEKQMAQQERAISKFSSRASGRAIKFMFPPPMGALGAARRIGGDIMRGAGVDVSLGSLVQRGIGIETAATALSNRGHIEGEAGANGQVVASSKLQSEARAVGLSTAVNPEELLSAGRAFVGLTGDLDLWRKIMPQVAKQTAALGGDQEEAAKAAGEFAAHVGDVPNKEKAILDLMAVAAGQGKIGGIDFSDFAKYASKAAAPAAQYAGDKAQNISQLTALAEIAKMHGGASSAAEAFTAISSLTTTLKKPARFKSIQRLLGNKNGQWADDEHTTLMGPQQLIKAMVVAAAKGNKDGKSSLDKLAAAVGDSRSLKAISGLQNTYNEAGGGQKGLDAMNEELKKFAGAVMSAGEVERANNAHLNTTAAKAELFNQSLEAITHGAMAELQPALENLREPALGLAQDLGKLVTWAAGNPWEALGAAAAAAVGRSIIESGMRGVIETSLKSALTATGINLEKAQLTVGAASLAVATLTLAWEQLEAFKSENGGWEGVAAFMGAGDNPYDYGFSAVDAVMDQQARDAAKNGGAPAPKPGAALKPAAPGTALPASWDLAPTPGFGAPIAGDGGSGKRDNAQLSKVHDAVQHMHDTLKGNLKVTVTNMPPGGPGGAPPAVTSVGRGPDPGLPRSWS